MCIKLSSIWRSKSQRHNGQHSDPKNIDPRENEKHGFVTQTDMKETEMLCRWTNQNQIGFQNTMIMHRGYNEHCNTDRVILSAAVEDTADINVVYKKYIDGKLLK